MFRTIIMLLLFCWSSCREIERYLPQDKKVENNTYSYACLDSAVGGARLGRALNKAGDAIRDLAVDEDKITDDLQSEYGAAFHKQMVQEQKAFKLLDDARLQQRLNTALQNLLNARPQPSAIKYAIYALNDTAINAFTFGGRIYITKAMLERTAGSAALLYAIIGHEIGHSEKGHIKKAIQELQLTTNIFGEANAGLVLQVTKLLTASFNQRNELEADYYGIELTNQLDQEVCSAVQFWREMSGKENSYNQVEDFFRTHPFSSLRAQCLQDHIMTRFGTACGGIDSAGVHPQLMSESTKMQ